MATPADSRTSTRPTSSVVKPGASKTPTTPLRSVTGKTAVGKPDIGRAGKGKLGAIAKDDTTPPRAARPRGIFFGMMVLFLGLEVAQLGIVYLNAALNYKLNKPVFFTLPFKLGDVTPLTILFVGVAILLYFVLIRFKILPTSQQLAQQRAATSNAATKSTAVAKGGVVKATSNANVKTAGRPMSAGKGTSFTITPKSKRDNDAIAESEITGDDDDHYDEVKAQLRAQARKKRK